jgi:hypothetical protein
VTAAATNGNLPDVFLRDRVARTTTRISVAMDGGDTDGLSQALTVSADGRFLVYTSLATNLVPGDTNATNDLFVFDRWAGRTSRLVRRGGAEPDGPSNFPAVTPDGRLILLARRPRTWCPMTPTPRPTCF